MHCYAWFYAWKNVHLAKDRFAFFSQCFEQHSSILAPALLSPAFGKPVPDCMQHYATLLETWRPGCAASWAHALEHVSMNPTLQSIACTCVCITLQKASIKAASRQSYRIERVTKGGAQLPWSCDLGLKAKRPAPPSRASPSVCYVMSTRAEAKPQPHPSRGAAAWHRFKPAAPQNVCCPWQVPAMQLQARSSADECMRRPRAPARKHSSSPSPQPIAHSLAMSKPSACHNHACPHLTQPVVINCTNSHT